MPNRGRPRIPCSRAPRDPASRGVDTDATRAPVHLAKKFAVDPLGHPLVVDLPHKAHQVVPAALELAVIERSATDSGLRGECRAADSPASTGHEIVRNGRGELPLQPRDLAAEPATRRAVVANEALACEPEPRGPPAGRGAADAVFAASEMTFCAAHSG